MQMELLYNWVYCFKPHHYGDSFKRMISILDRMLKFEATYHQYI